MIALGIAILLIALYSFHLTMRIAELWESHLTLVNLLDEDQNNAISELTALVDEMAKSARGESEDKTTL
tara:strand:- start:3705 stop:3911 length:207 start_codon:yes stop_codon:yes gene_type:complete